MQAFVFSAHYLENRGKITLEKEGLNHNGNRYLWSDIKDTLFEDLDFDKKYKFLTLEFKKPKIKHQGWTDNKLYVSKNTIGFGNFIKNLPNDFPSLNLNYLKHFENPEFCEICGYEAVYNEKCECCENDTWISYQKKVIYKDEEEEKYDHIRYCQILWEIDEGEICESGQMNYHKNPNYKIQFTDDDLNEYLQYNNDD